MMQGTGPKNKQKNNEKQTKSILNLTSSSQQRKHTKKTMPHDKVNTKYNPKSLILDFKNCMINQEIQLNQV